MSLQDQAARSGVSSISSFVAKSDEIYWQIFTCELMRKPSRLTLIATALGTTFVGIAALILLAIVYDQDAAVVSVENETDLRLCNEASGNANIEACTRAIQSNRHTDRSLAWAFNKRGTLYYAAGEYDRALADFNASILINPEDAPAFRNRCAVHIQKRNHDRAVADCSEALRSEPKLEDAYYNRGLAYYHLTRYREAILDFDASLNFNPKREDALYMRDVAQLKNSNTTSRPVDVPSARNIDPVTTHQAENPGVSRQARGCILGARVQGRAVIAHMLVVPERRLGVFDVAEFDCGIKRIVAGVHSGNDHCKVGMTLEFSGEVRRAAFGNGSAEFYLWTDRTVCK